MRSDRNDYRLRFCNEDESLRFCLGEANGHDVETYQMIKEYVLPLLRERGILTSRARAMLRVLADQAKFIPARVRFFDVSEKGPKNLPSRLKKYRLELNDDPAHNRAVIVKPIRALSGRVMEMELAQYYMWYGDVLVPGTIFKLRSVSYPGRHVAEGILL